MILAQKGLEPLYLNALDVGAGLAFAHVSELAVAVHMSGYQKPKKP